MRVLPQSIAGRTTLVLIAGILVILAIGTAVFSLGMFDGARPPRPGKLIERVVSLTAIVNGVPAAVRPDVLSAWTPRSGILADLEKSYCSNNVA